LSFSQDQPLKRGSILRGNLHMNRAFHSVALAAALFLSTAFTSPATHQPSAATMTTQKFEFVSNGNGLSGFVDLPAGGAAPQGVEFLKKELEVRKTRPEPVQIFPWVPHRR
jgi:hypothetical protein